MTEAVSLQETSKKTTIPNKQLIKAALAAHNQKSSLRC